MNYLGHKSVAIATLPFILFPIQKFNDNFHYSFLNSFVDYFQDIIVNFFNLIETHNYIVILSLISYWIGSTFIDFIDFKIIKKVIRKDNRKSVFLYHRQWTHGFIDNLIFLGLSIYALQYSVFAYILVFYFLGVWTHLFSDMITGSIPIFFYGHYAKSFSRIGINRIIPSYFHEIFSKKLPIIADKYSFIGLIVGIGSFLYFKGFEEFLLPLLNSI